MTYAAKRRLALIGGFFLAMIAIVAGVWWFAFAAALDQLETRGRSDLALASDRLTGQLQRFRELSVLLADHPTLTPVVLEGAAQEPAEARLLEMADKTGSLALLVAASDGAVLAASGPVSGAILNNVALRPSFRRAMHAALGTEHWVEQDTGQRIFAFAAPIQKPAGAAQGAVMVQVDIEALEAQTPTQASPVYFRDSRGVIFVTNRSELVLTSFSANARAGYTSVRDRTVNGHEIWSLELGPYLPRQALHLTQPLPVIGMTSEILLDLAPVLKIANLQAMVAAAFCLAFGAMLYIAAQRLRTEAATNLALEARVQDRTRELSLLNADLLREIAERTEAETALTRAQAELVQAGKLSALGQMSAGISHELNQPLMAIQSFAENGEILLDRGKPEAARENLGKIGELANRMGRIIRNLRAFARQETVPVSDVDVLKVIAAALEIASPKIDQAGVAVDWTPPVRPLMVRGGEVRLQQVVMNLLSNAVDAMEASDEKRLEIKVMHGDPVTISIRDTGPGIDDAEKIFDPFYSTKKVGEAAGMGLGLSISYGVVQSFGGAIRGCNHPGGGAIFTVELTPARMEQAA